MYVHGWYCQASCANKLTYLPKSQKPQFTSENGGMIVCSYRINLYNYYNYLYKVFI